jgi:hypothetical protein
LLSSSASFDATDTTLADVSNSNSYLVSGNGWGATGEVIADWSADVYGSDGAQISATDITVEISGGDLGPFTHYLIHNSTDDAAVALVTLDPAKTVPDGEVAHIPWAEAAVLRCTLRTVAGWSWYNHTAKRFLSGANSDADTYKVVLLNSSAVFNANHVTYNDATNSGASAVAGYGWDTGGEEILNWAAAVASTNEGAIEADDTEAAIIGAALGPFSYWLIINTTDNAVVAFVTLASATTVPNGYLVQFPWTDGTIITLEAPA